MAVGKAGARLASVTLPSMSLADLATRWGCTLDQLGEYIRTDVLACVVLLHDLNVEVPQAAGGPPETITLDGHYQLPTKWAATALNEQPDYLSWGGAWIEVIGAESDCPIRVPMSLKARDLRVMREEVERFEREELAGETTAREVKTPAMRNAERHKERSQAIATFLWQRDPEIRIAQMASHDAVISIGCEGTVYGEKTMHGWLKDLCPNPRPGRPKKPPA